VNFTFQPRWKEELVCSSASGTFVLEFPMGVPTVYLPDENRWKEVAPSWAVEHWPALNSQLKSWCDQNKIEFMIDRTANVY
jgi:hypothetical protein